MQCIKLIDLRNIYLNMYNVFCTFYCKHQVQLCNARESNHIIQQKRRCNRSQIDFIPMAVASHLKIFIPQINTKIMFFWKLSKRTEAKDSIYFFFE